MNRVQGYTVTELLLTMLVVALLLGVGVPSMRSLLRDTELSALVSAYMHTFNSARYIAVSERRQLAICSPDAEGQCSGAWSEQLQLFYDDDRDGVLARHEDIVQVFTLPDPDDIRVTFRAFARTRYVALRGNGHYRQNGTFRFCPREGGRGKAIVINVMGRARTERIECAPA